MTDDRDARAREVEQLRTERDELERSRIDVEAQFHEARTAWEEQKQQQEARFAAERQAWDRQREEHEQAPQGGKRWRTKSSRSRPP